MQILKECVNLISSPPLKILIGFVLCFHYLLHSLNVLALMLCVGYWTKKEKSYDCSILYSLIWFYFYTIYSLHSLPSFFRVHSSVHIFSYAQSHTHTHVLFLYMCFHILVMLVSGWRRSKNGFLYRFISSVWNLTDTSACFPIRVFVSASAVGQSGTLFVALHSLGWCAASLATRSQ